MTAKAQEFSFYENKIPSSLSNAQRSILATESKRSVAHKRTQQQQQILLYDDDEPVAQAVEEEPPKKSRTTDPRYPSVIEPVMRRVGNGPLAFDAPDEPSPQEVAAARIRQSAAMNDTRSASSLGFLALPEEEKSALVAETWGPLLDDLSKEHQCIRCDTTYIERENIGRMYCFYHPGAPCAGRRWTCCPESTSANNSGCTGCDHSVVHFSVNSPDPPTTEVPVVLLPILKPKRECVIRLQKAGPGRELESKVAVVRALKRNSEAVRTYNACVNADDPYGEPKNIGRRPKLFRVTRAEG